MAQTNYGSAGVTTQEIDQSGPVAAEPIGVPAGVIGTATKGRAFVPTTMALKEDFAAKFGATDGVQYGPLAAYEWLKNRQALTYLRVLGVGDGKTRTTSGNTAGIVTNAGFTVGEPQPNTDSGLLGSNPYANSGGVLGRTYFLGAFMSESLGSTVFSAAGLQGPGSVTPGNTTSVPILRGVLMAASGVLLRLSSSVGANAAPASTLVASDTFASGQLVGNVVLSEGTLSKQDFVLLLNGHKGLDSRYPNVVTASFDPTAANYFANILNTDPYKLQQAGHYLYAFWSIQPSLAVVTGSGLIASASGAGASTAQKAGVEIAAFLTTGSLARNTGNTTVPNFENFNDRFRTPRTPWFVSQKFGGVAKNLFRIHALDDGNGTLGSYKISVENITPSADAIDKYGTFDIVVRSWSDDDSNVLPIESWRGLSLNPSSDRYVAKVIGDYHVYFDFDRNESSQRLTIDGNYPNRSNYIRVEVDSLVDNGTIDPTALPVGFRGLGHLVTSGSAPLATYNPGNLNVAAALNRVVQPPVPYRTVITDGSGQKAQANSNYYWGVQFEQVTDPTLPNGQAKKEASIVSYSKYFPDFMTSVQNAWVSDNQGTADSSTLGILDADRFNNNFFSLENIQVVTASDGAADAQKWASAVYVRNGVIAASDSAKTRALSVVSDFTQANRRFLKFSTIMQGGFDGVNVFDRAEATLSDVAVTQDMLDTNRGLVNGPSVKAYRKAIDIMKNTSEVDIQVLATPGIRHSIVTDYAISAVEDRFDALYIMDVQEYDTLGFLVTGSAQNPSVTNTVTQFKNRAMNTSFGAAYYPDVVMQDPTTKTAVVAPPSVAVLGALALNDAVGYPWFAPAGFTRGALPTTLETKVHLSKANLDQLYDANINPLTAFVGNTPAGSQASGGVVVWGQRTLQSFASALDRVNVRRLLIAIRREIRDIGYSIVFEPSREATLAKFQARVEPVLRRVQSQAGVEKYRVNIDTTTTTKADIENLTLRGKIVIKPIKSIEYVSLDFVINNAGVSV